MQLTTTSSWLFLAGILLFSCAKEPVNPYDQIEDPNQETEEETELDPTSIMGLHANVFRPTCANSGCHDGTFEPDFPHGAKHLQHAGESPHHQKRPTGDLYVPGRAG
jgi:hypothetical protein